MSQLVPHSMSLYVLLTQVHCPIPVIEAADMVIRGGADVIQLREKDASDNEIIQLGRALRRMTAEADILFMLNDRPDLARLIGADGCHLGQDDIPPAAARKILAPWQILGVSTHSVHQARQAVADGADYIGAGPVFPTATKGYDSGVGLDYIRQATAAVPCPLIAIGGITASRAGEVIQAGDPTRIGVAICSAILGADDIEAETRRFRRVVDAVR